MNAKRCKMLRKAASITAEKKGIPRLKYTLHPRKTHIVLDHCERKLYKELKQRG